MVLKMLGQVMASSRPCYLSPTGWCNLRECFPSKNVKCKLEKEKEIIDKDRQRIYNWSRAGARGNRD